MDIVEWNGLKIIRCYAKDNLVYKEATLRASTGGIVVHSTGVNQTWLGRYVQPSPNDENKDELIKFLGANKIIPGDGSYTETSGNSWNRDQGKGNYALVHFMIGKASDGSLAVMQLQPIMQTTGGSYYGPNGSYNPTHVQFEILEDGKEDKQYFLDTTELAAKLCAYICTTCNVDVSNICSHKECGERGYGSTHIDPEGNWWYLFDGDMDWFRTQVSNILNGKEFEPPKEKKRFSKGDKVNIKSGVTTWVDGSKIADWLKTSFPYLWVMTGDANTTTITCKEDLSVSSGVILTENLVAYGVEEVEDEDKGEPDIVEEETPEQEDAEVDKITELEDTIVEYKQELDLAKEQCASLQEMVDALKEQNNSYQKDIATLNEIVAERDAEIEKLKENTTNGSSLIDAIINFIKGFLNK